MIWSISASFRGQQSRTPLKMWRSQRLRTQVTTRGLIVPGSFAMRSGVHCTPPRTSKSVITLFCSRRRADAVFASFPALRGRVSPLCGRLRSAVATICTSVESSFLKCRDPMLSLKRVVQTPICLLLLSFLIAPPARSQPFRMAGSRSTRLQTQRRWTDGARS